MRLLSMRLDGHYKGLHDQTFNFGSSRGNIIAFIGLNGSGKSQLLELMAETFGYLERYLRGDFKCRNWFDSMALELNYSNQVYDSDPLSHDYKITINRLGKVLFLRDDEIVDTDIMQGAELQAEIDKFLPSQIIGYSSGLNENLQRSFMKNSVQYLDAMNAKRAWEVRLAVIKNNWDSKGEYLTESDLEIYDSQISDAYNYYQRRYQGIFPALPENVRVSENPELGLRATQLPRLKYLDHDATALLLTSLGSMSDEEQKAIWNEKLRFNKVNSVTIKYDLRKFTHDAGALHDVVRLVRCIGGVNSDNFSHLPNIDKTSEEFYNQFELDYLAGEIKIDFSQSEIQNMFNNVFDEPEVLFEKLYRLQLLGAEFWPGELKRKLRQDNFIGGVKKPQKWKSPIQILSLKLTDGVDCIEFDDLSDGEAQLIQTLAMAAVYKNSRTLFLLDEPETHLNPSWRTYFHTYLDEVVNQGRSNEKLQMFISTHSPFMISSLQKENVFLFERYEEGIISMIPMPSQTYGASFEVLIKKHFGLRSLISQTAVEAVKEHLPKDEQPESIATAKKWVEENLGDSMERAYLLRKLQN
tara:strand:- start:11287 stop:13032 length:1746 start_codon:yes stop_codon:yes gene_type:complete